MSTPPTTAPTRQASTVRIPADIDQPDRLAFGLTARQLTIAAITAMAAWSLFLALDRLLGPAAGAIVAVPVVLAGLLLLLGRRDGLGLDQFMLAAVRYARSPGQLVPAPEGVPALPAWAVPADRADRASARRRLAPMRLPARGLAHSGVVDLGADGAALICRATEVPLALRTTAEQHAAVAAFARFLHAIPASVQLVLHAERVDLAEQVIRLRQAAGGLPHPALEAAAHEHATFLAVLAGQHDLLRRELLLVFHDPATPADPTVLLRRAEEAAGLLAAAGSTLTVLDAEQATAVLARLATPAPPTGAPPRPAGLAPPDAVITHNPGAAP